jgi:hypothetical protein
MAHVAQLLHITGTICKIRIDESNKLIMKRLGFHYFSDTQHYRQHDLQIWLPRLKSFSTQWLVLNAPTNRAIPEDFIRVLIDNEIKPILHFHIHPNQIPDQADLQLLFNTYKRWGVQYAALFDQPNIHNVWRSSDWAQTDLVERFLDLYLPLANNCLNACLTPIFPPLRPGGDYWDTAFIRRALESLQRRRQHRLLEQLILGVFSDPGEKPIQWGAGGPERWPNARPYFTPQGIEDQRGFRIFDWYLAISQAVLSSPLPLFLFGIGYTSTVDNYVHRNLTIARLLTGEFIEGYEPIPPKVIGGAFKSLTDTSESTENDWFGPNGEPNQQAEAFHQLAKKISVRNQPKQADPSLIRHYLLLPSFEWGISDFHLDVIRPIIKRYQPTVGFSLEEAKNARRVTVVGGEEVFSEAILNQLRAAGITVNRIEENGTNIASVIATLS